MSETCWRLPPLILHPFSDACSPDRLALSAQANLILHGLLPAANISREELNRTLLEGRFCEIRMLFYLGKDLSRWLDQCLEVVERDDVLRSAGIQRESFASLLVNDPPAPVQEKLHAWGVADYQVIFRRALGLHAVFAVPPERDSLAEGFIRCHHRYADGLFECRLESVHFTEVQRAHFHFELYASGEYARLLEKQWEPD